MGGIFVSYRRRDRGERAMRLAQALVRAFGREQVLFDVEALRADENFAAAIAAAADASTLSLVLIGPGWLAASDRSGRRCLDRDDDLVRLEVAAALARPAPVLLVLVGGAARPAAEDLPADLSGLAQIEAVVLSDARWGADLERLLLAIEAAGGPPRLKPGGTPAVRLSFHWVALAAALLLIALVWLGLGTAWEADGAVTALAPVSVHTP